MQKGVLLDSNSFFMRTGKSDKKAPRRKSKRLKTLSDVKKKYNPRCLLFSGQKAAQRNSHNSRPFYHSQKKKRKSRAIITKTNKQDYFKTLPFSFYDPLDEETTNLLHIEFFGSPPKKSETELSGSNLKFDLGSESREFVELQNQSIHISRIFKSGLSKSFTNSQLPLKSGIFEEGGNKENCQGDKANLLEMIMHFDIVLRGADIEQKIKSRLGLSVMEMKRTLGGEGGELENSSFGECLRRKKPKFGCQSNLINS